MPKRRLKHSTFMALRDYMKYRYSHKPLEEQRMIKRSIIQAIRAGGEDKEREFVEGVKGFMRTNRVVIEEARKHECHNQLDQSRVSC